MTDTATAVRDVINDARTEATSADQKATTLLAPVGGVLLACALLAVAVVLNAAL